jgi:hypothetical protein
MMFTSLKRLFAIVSLSTICFAVEAQPVKVSGNNPTEQKEAKPYKILTSGKQITIKSTKAIKHVMLWTTGGNRVVEQKEINNNSYTFTIPVNQKTFFLMIGLEGGKIYTEKVGLRE